MQLSLFSLYYPQSIIADTLESFRSLMVPGINSGKPWPGRLKTLPPNSNLQVRELSMMVSGALLMVCRRYFTWSFCSVLWGSSRGVTMWCMICVESRKMYELIFLEKLHAAASPWMDSRIFWAKGMEIIYCGTEGRPRGLMGGHLIVPPQCYGAKTLYHSWTESKTVWFKCSAGFAIKWMPYV